MPEVALVMSPRQPYALRELASTLQHELELQSVPSSLRLDGFPEPRPSLVYVLLDPGTYVVEEGMQALPADRILRRTIVLSAEAPPSADEEERIAVLRTAAAVFAPDQQSVMAMHRLGIPARLIKPGYSKSLDRFDPTAPRPIDVLFVGVHSLRRTRHLSRAARVLSRHNCVLQVGEVAPDALDANSPLAQARWPLLARAKVLISLHRDDQRRFDWRGAVDAIHAGAVVVTEHSSGIPPLVPGEHLVVVGADSLPFVVEDLLSDEPRLAQLRSQAYERLRTWVPYALSVAVLRAAIVELVGEPVPPGASLGQLSPRAEPGDSASGSVPIDSEWAMELFQPKAPSVEVVHESPGWTSRRAPLVTVVTALRSHDEQARATDEQARATDEQARATDEQARATLESLAETRLRDFELVIVDNGSSEQTHATAADWISRHPRMAAQLVRTVDTGLGAARNVGLDSARGRFVLILDSGQEVYPRCLEVLAETLDAMSEMAFVWPMQEVIGAPDAFVAAGGDYLLSFLGWDPRHLRLGNGIHAPALIRTVRLRELGGFATDARLVGFEDYDLWCRMAQRGWRGQLVSQVLARRAELGWSRTLSAIHPVPGDAATALMHRAPRVMSGAL